MNRVVKAVVGCAAVAACSVSGVAVAADGPQEVVPEAPYYTLSPENAPCGVSPKFEAPEMVGVEYERKPTNGNWVTVVARAKPGYVIKEGAQTEWTMRSGPTACMPEPRMSPGEKCGVMGRVTFPNDPNVFYDHTSKGTKVHVTTGFTDRMKYAVTIPTIFPEWDFDVSAQPCEDESGGVIPVAPRLIDAHPTACGLQPSVVVPEDSKKVEYGQFIQDGKLTVFAAPAPGVKLAEGAQTWWMFDVHPNECTGDLEIPYPVKPIKDIDQKFVDAGAVRGPASKVVTPLAPRYTLKPEDAPCGVMPKYEIPEVEGVTYDESAVSGRAHIVARAKPGYFLVPGAQTEWDIDTSTLMCVPAPTVEYDESCGVMGRVVFPQQDRIVLTHEAKGSVVSVRSEYDPRKELTGYRYPQWDLDVSAKACPTGDALVAPTLVPVPKGVCGVQPSVAVPANTDTVKYAQYIQDGELTVQASNADGTAVSGVQSEWTFDVHPVECGDGDLVPNSADTSGDVDAKFVKAGAIRGKAPQLPTKPGTDTPQSGDQGAQSGQSGSQSGDSDKPQSGDHGPQSGNNPQSGQSGAQSTDQQPSLDTPQPDRTTKPGRSGNTAPISRLARTGGAVPVSLVGLLAAVGVGAGAVRRRK